MLGSRRAENGLNCREDEYEAVRVEARATNWNILASLDVAMQSWNETKEHNEGEWS